MSVTLLSATLDNPVVRANSPAPMVTGAFVQFNEKTAEAGRVWWEESLSDMRVIGFDTVVVQYAGYDDYCYYPTEVAALESSEVDSIAHILAAAEQSGIKVFLGLHLEGSFWSNQFDLSKRLKLNEAMLDELHQCYGKSSALAGWYIPEEISDYTPDKAHVDDLLQYIRKLTQRAHDQTKLPVMLSPYFGQNPNAEKYADWWDKTVLPTTGVDIVAMQDGVGTHRTTTEESRPIFEALAPVMKRHNVRFWANNESFDQTVGWPLDDDEDAFDAQPVGFDHFLGQFFSTAPFVEKSITFEFTQYMSPENPGRSRDLYNAYQRYRDSSRSLPHLHRTTPVQQPIGTP